MNTGKSKFSGLIAPCGMNCGVCIGFLRDKKPCPGCQSDSDSKPVHCAKCSILNCGKLNKTLSHFCYDCEIYPCARLKRLDKRYRENYGMSMIENLECIHSEGLEAFIAKEEYRWACKKCGATLSAHRDYCLNCLAKKN